MTTIDSLDISRAILEDREHRSIMKAAVPAPRSRRATWNDAIRKLVSLGKSFPGDEVEDDSIDFDSEIADGISAGYVSRVPSRQEIPVSPTTSASGAGAEQLPRWSSDPATQSGITELYRRFSAMMEQFSELKKSQMDVIESVTNLAKATKAAFPDSEEDVADEDDDEEVEKSKIGKALSGQGLTTGTIKEVLNILSSSRHGSSPPYFAQHVLRKASAQEVDFYLLTSEQLIKYQSAKQMLGAAANGVNINHDLLDQAARVVANPTGGV